jgi:hypothetical protein
VGLSSPQSDASNDHSKGSKSKVPKYAHLTAEEEEEALTVIHLKEKHYCATCKAPCLVSDDGKHRSLPHQGLQIWAREIVSVVVF